MFKVYTSAVPFLNARIQGLDIIWRGGTGQYSAVRSQLEGSQAEIARQIQINMLTRGAFLMFLTAMYYAWVSEEDEYKNAIKLNNENNLNNLNNLKNGIPIFIMIPYHLPNRNKIM